MSFCFILKPSLLARLIAVTMCNVNYYVENDLNNVVFIAKKITLINIFFTLLIEINMFKLADKTVHIE
ncbi:hypothetical protein D0907_05730 [Pseudoalteromonas lipolytica]|uniref:Uncharacterized protein n=1 Tax=Pseudoalteromonas lipolytica TaxID=570156 RepID=A0AAD0RYB9_9GAMM|nr:hypothetical protein D0907_05730 [Pseudoalteromonas donghaensis]